MKIQEISCEVCLDLLPLVQDEVASPDSASLVRHHLDTCESCRAAMGQNPLVEVNSKRILFRLRCKVTLWVVLFIVLGTVLGFLLSKSVEGLAFNMVLMPVIGAASYRYLKKRWFITPACVTGIMLVWRTLYCLRHWPQSGLASALTDAGMLAAVHGVLCLVGVLAAFLFAYAFEKEKK